jgi:uncharacterized protein YrrD
MQFKQGVGVRTSDGKSIGQLDRVVVDPRTREVNYLIVRKGAFFTTDRVVPLTLIARAGENEVVLREDAGDLEQLPPFEERYYVPADSDTIAPANESAPSLYPYPPVLGGEMGGIAGMSLPTPTPLGALTVPQPVVEQTERAIPDDNVAIRSGVRVVGADGETVGSVEQVLTGQYADQVTHFVVSQGVLFKDRKLIPVGWVESMGEDQIRLAVDSKFVARLGSYDTERRGGDAPSGSR